MLTILSSSTHNLNVQHIRGLDNTPSRLDECDKQPPQADYKWTSPADSYGRYLTADLLICTRSSNCNNKQLWNQSHLCPWRDRDTHQQQCARDEYKHCLFFNEEAQPCLVCVNHIPLLLLHLDPVYGGRSFSEGGD